MENELTFGQRRIRINSNDNPQVRHVKQLHADIIDNLEAQKKALQISGPADETPAAFQLRAGEEMRLIAVAQTEVELTCLIVVKAITKPS